MSGATQGEKKETSPAPNAARRVPMPTAAPDAMDLPPTSPSGLSILQQNRLNGAVQRAIVDRTDEFAHHNTASIHKRRLWGSGHRVIDHRGIGGIRPTGI